jgi:hypothetical protein
MTLSSSSRGVVHNRHGSDSHPNMTGDRNPMISPGSPDDANGDAESSIAAGLKSPAKPPVVATWANMPHKDQLTILAASRFVDFFQMAALQTFMVHQLQSFGRSLSRCLEDRMA